MLCSLPLEAYGDSPGLILVNPNPWVLFISVSGVEAESLSAESAYDEHDAAQNSPNFQMFPFVL